MSYRPKQQHAPVDPNVVIPKAVRAAAEASERLAQQMNDAPPAQQASDAPPAPVAPIVPDQAATPAPDPQPTHTPAPVEPIAPGLPVASSPTPTSTPAPQDDALQNRVRTAEGRAAAEARRAQEAEAQNANLRALLASVSLQQPLPPRPSEIQSFQNLLTPEERENYGDDFIDVVKRAAKEVIGSEIQPLHQQIDGINQKMSNFGQHTQQQMRSNFFDAMDRSLPEWRDLNNDKEFLAWLNLTDPLSGVKRHELLNKAVAQSDSQRALMFFKSYQAELAVTAPRAEPPKPHPAQSLASLAAPGRATTAATGDGASAPKQIITAAQIQKFYQDVVKGVYAGRDPERLATERAIFAAQAEGRIR